MMKFVGFLITAWALLSTAHAQTCNVTLRTALNESEPLYFRVGDTKKYVGISSDVVAELRDRTDCGFDTIVVNRSKLYQEMSATRIDFALVTIRNDRFDKIAKFFPIAFTSRELAATRALIKTHPNVESFIKDSKIKFIILPGASYFFKKAESEKLEKESRYVTTTSLQEAYELLKRTPNAAVIQNDFVNDYFFKKKNMKDFDRVPDKGEPFAIGAYYISRRGAEKAASSIEKALADMGTDGTWRKIVKRYTEASDKSEASQKP